MASPAVLSDRSSPQPGGRVSADAPVSLAAITSLLRGLNRQQRQAVSHGSGPLLVVAGPGTGKTEVVTRRVAWLIAAKRALPRQILALTFTDNAAQEMQARVDLLVPYGQADTAIHTFHAFGDRLLREFSFELGLPGDVRLLGRPELITLLREHLFELGLQRYLPLGDPTRFLGALVDLFARAKDEDVWPADFDRHAGALLARAAESSDEQRATLADLAAARAELAAAYAAYCQLLARRGCIDHADQVALALRLLRERPLVRAEIRERYSYLLVDELQDTNRAQLSLVLALSGPQANVTAVGDADQGIYTFRGAVPGNVGRFAAAHPSLRRIVLRRNYRSRAPIIEASYRLIGHNLRLLMTSPEQVADERSQPVAHRRARRPAPVRLAPYRTSEQEVDAIAAEVARRVKGGARAGDFAVLVRSNRECDAFVRSLRAHGMPVHTGLRPDLLELPAVRALLALLRVVADPSDSLELYTLAAAPPYELGGAELADLLKAVRRRHHSLWQILVEAVDDSAGAPFRASGASRAAQLVEHVRAAIEMSHVRTSGEVLYGYLRHSGTLARLASADGPAAAELAGIARFFEFVRATASLLAVDRVPFLVPHLQAALPAGEDAEDGPPDDAVAVLTVHRAKGLEFRVVFLAGLVDGRFPVRGRPPLLALPPELTDDGADADPLAEERRLFYVAMTRTRDELWLSYHTTAAGGRNCRPSPFIAEALDLPPAQLPADARRVADGPTQMARLAPPPPPPAASATRSAGPLSLSFSQVDDYVTCPERYRLRHVVGLPTPAHHALSYGSALHGAIAAFHVAQGQGVTMSEEELLGEFGRHWTGEGFLSREHEEARYAAGQDTLRRFRAQQLASGVMPVAIERPFRFRLGPDLIVGRVDRLDRTADGVVITDYKASDVPEQKRADVRARDSLQLQVYALAHQAETGTLPAQVQLHFLDSSTIGRSAPDEARLDKARRTLASAAEGMRAGDFPARPSAFACGYCPYRQICAASAAA